MSGPIEDALVPPAPAVSNNEVAKGAGLAAISRLGALIEVIAQPAYTWMFGLTGYGVYVVLWAAINILANILDLAMGQALQRIVPADEDEGRQHGAVKFALATGTGLGMIAALAITLSANWLAGFVATSPEDAGQIPRSIALFAWSLPLWIFVEIATAAARAKRAFGPEIRLRIFWEQVARLLFAAGFFVAGYDLLGLLLGHMLSLAVTAILSAQLLGRYYNLRLLVTAPLTPVVRGLVLKAGIAMLPPAIARRAYNDLPPILLNLMVPGAAGATAAGLYGIARKIASIPLIVRQSFLYVLSPLASSQASVDRGALLPMYRFSTHMSVLLAVPLAGFMILIASDMLSGFAPGAAAALPVLAVLLAARAGEAVIGPATPIVEMIGHRALPLLNSTIGLALWLVLAMWLVPLHGALGMAISVSVAVVVTAWAAVVELRISDQLNPFGKGFFRALLAGLSIIGLLWAVGEALTPFGARVRAISLFVLFWPSLWFGLRFGLDESDKSSLGKLGQKLRL
ncbi:MAG: lipopolysaccharide biosynthesis protein [Sphingorhabdus sp.]|uniref:lipopolysaccharide biosynthesis protein n=1 Tax=Sphingorhabdus sp. TaxID=1902408 RepID=UPI0038FC701E